MKSSIFCNDGTNISHTVSFSLLVEDEVCKLRPLEIAINTTDQLFPGSTQSHLPSLLICFKPTRSTDLVLLRGLCKQYDTVLLRPPDPFAIVLRAADSCGPNLFANVT